MKKLSNIFLILIVILTGGLAVFLFLDFKKNSRKLKKIVKNVRKLAEDSVEKLENNGFEEMGWSDLDWTNEEILSKKKEEVVDDLKDYLSKVEKPMKSIVKEVKQNPIVKNLKPVLKTAALKSNVSGLNERQDSIVSMIEDKRKLNMAEISTKFPGITSRTLRRDMEKLEKLKITKQIGKTRDSYYVLVDTN
jgi:uncharacterized membrane protein YgaE (UPF0421/DUF939 family)